MYAQLLANSHTSPASLKNYLSGAKHWIIHHVGDPSAFLSPPVQDVIKRLSSTSDHVPSQALPITPTELNIICRFLDEHTSYPAAIKPAILISFTCMLRASNITSPSAKVWGGAHTLNRGDITITPTGLSVVIRSTKTTGGPIPAIIDILAIPGSASCPRQAWIHYLVKDQPPLSGPAFITPEGRPLVSSPIAAAIRAALSAAGYSEPKRYSIHSLRRGSAQLACALGASNADIMSHGLWASQSGLRYYTHPASNKVSHLLARGLAN